MISELHSVALDAIGNLSYPDRLLLMNCTEKTTNEKVTLLCIVHNYDTEQEDVKVIPIAKMLEKDDIDLYEPPDGFLEGKEEQCSEDSTPST